MGSTDSPVSLQPVIYRGEKLEKLLTRILSDGAIGEFLGGVSG